MSNITFNREEEKILELGIKKMSNITFNREEERMSTVLSEAKEGRIKF
jgi:hypothetical protein